MCICFGIISSFSLSQTQYSYFRVVSCYENALRSVRRKTKNYQKIEGYGRLSNKKNPLAFLIADRGGTGVGIGSGIVRKT